MFCINVDRIPVRTTVDVMEPISSCLLWDEFEIKKFINHAFLFAYFG